MKSYKNYYSKFIQNAKLRNVLHFTAASHHYWPDFSREVGLDYWDLASQFVDQKWEVFFNKIYLEYKTLVAKILNLENKEQIAFSSNTHELIVRLLSCFKKEKIKVVTTNSEFYSWSRQIEKLEKHGLADVVRVDAKLLIQNKNLFFEKILEECKKSDVDLLFISQVFFNSGVCILIEELKRLIDEIPNNTIVCIDGYHGFCALPTDLSILEGRVFYLAGGYKYAQSGEGNCFMVVPKTPYLEPLNTGWFSSFSILEASKDNDKDSLIKENTGFSFLGATYDFSSMMRFNVIWKKFFEDGITIEEIHKFVKNLQNYFLEKIKDKKLLKNSTLIKREDIKDHGHFLTFEFLNSKVCTNSHKELLEKGIITDYRQNCLRFGFGMYHDFLDIDKCINLLD
jgi:selenocysteine lyase/cysteine desulfurase